MTVLTENLVLSKEETLNSTHEWATLTCEVRSSLALECSLEQVTWTDTDTESKCTIESTTSSIVVNCVWRVQTATLEEHSTEWCTRTLRSNHDNVDILRRNATCAVRPCDSETMWEIESLTRSEVLLESWPYRHYCSIRKKTHNDSTLLSSLLNREEGLAWYPTVILSLLEGLALTLTNDYIETIVAKVTSLSRTLNAITDNSNSLILENLTGLLKWEFLTCHYLFDNATKIHFCHC